jgi:NAD-dependent oxidoreductase involved in siderophore biosynthesis
MQESSLERISKHLALIVKGIQHLQEHPPHSSEELEMQRLFADAAVEVALEIVCQFLPSEFQPTVKRLIELHDVIWHRGVEREGDKHP